MQCNAIKRNKNELKGEEEEEEEKAFQLSYFFCLFVCFRNVSEIPDTEVTSFQILSYDPERDLLPIIRAHCHYSLKVGHGTVVEYDWTAIQRHLIDRFIRGKSLIVFKVKYFIGLWFVIKTFCFSILLYKPAIM